MTTEVNFNNLNEKFFNILPEEWRERLESLIQLSHEIVFERDVIINTFCTLSRSGSHYIFVFRESTKNLSLIIFLQEGNRFTLNESIGKVNDKIISKFEFKVNMKYSSRLDSPQLESPRLVSPRLISPRLVSPRLIS